MSIVRRLYAPLSEHKRDSVVPQLRVIKGPIFGCCATYIKEDYEDIDLEVQTVKEPKKELSLNKAFFIKLN